MLARSRIAAVGRPPLQKNASILPSLSASTDAFTRQRLPADVAVRIEPGGRAAMRNAITSVPLPGEPVETTLPRRSASRSMPLPSIVDDVRVVRIEHGQRARPHRAGPLKRPSRARAASQRVGQRERDVDLALLDQLEVVDRGRRDLGGRLTPAATR